MLTPALRPKLELLRPELVASIIDEALALLDRQGGQVIHVDRLDAVLPVAEHRKNGELAQQPGDVVDQDVFLAEQNGRTQDRVRDAEVLQVAFQLGLAAEILQRRVF